MPAPRTYPDELRGRAVREVQTSGPPVAHVARDLGIHKEALRQCVRQSEADQGDRSDLLSTAEKSELAQLRQRNAELSRANEILKAARCFSRRSSTSPARSRRGDQPSPRRLRGRAGLSGTGAVGLGIQRPPQAAEVRLGALRDEQLLAKIRAAHATSGETYGARKIHRQLRREGVTAARWTTERLMREDSLEGVIRGQRRRTRLPEPTAPRPPGLVNRLFTATRPNQLWVADLTYVWTWSGWVYVASVLDVHSRTIVGWQLATHMCTDLPLDACSGLVGEEAPGERGAGELLVHQTGEEQQRVAGTVEHRKVLGLPRGVAGDRDDDLQGLALNRGLIDLQEAVVAEVAGVEEVLELMWNTCPRQCVAIPSRAPTVFEPRNALALHPQQHTDASTRSGCGWWSTYAGPGWCSSRVSVSSPQVVAPERTTVGVVVPREAAQARL